MKEIIIVDEFSKEVESAIKISELLKHVNETFPDILPEDVLVISQV